jgi:type IV pilus assembly protein PilO
MNLQAISIDLQDIGSRFLQNGIAVLTGTVSSLAALFYFLGIQPALEELSALQNRENSLISAFEVNAKQAATLEAYKRQLNEMDDYLAQVVSQLPRGSEVARFLADISQIGVSNGLIFELFNLNPEVRQDIYIELPIKIRVTGNYHGFAAFVAKLASIPHIASIHDIRLTPNTAEKADPNRTLIMEALIKTYHQPDDAHALGEQHDAVHSSLSGKPFDFAPGTRKKSYANSIEGRQTEQ